MAKYYFSRCELDTDRHQLVVAGIPRHIEPRVFDLLRFFVERSDRLVSREDLIEHIWHGRIVTDSAISVSISAARKAVGDNGTEQAIIQTIPRRGFKFLAKAIRVDSGTQRETAGPIRAGSGTQQETAGPIQLSAEPDLFPEHDDRPALAVFRFECAGDENHADYLGRGIADDIATELSRFHTLTVISTFSTFKHDTATGDTAEFCASLGATHIVTGSIQLTDSQLRLTARLGDADTNKNIWSERYDISLDELFAAQDDVVANIVGNLFSRLHDYQMSVARQKPTTNLSAYDCVLRGLKIYKSGHVTEREARQALFWFDRAAELDPHYARALAWRACAGSNFWSNPPTGEDLAAPMTSMKLAMSVDPGDHEVHRLKGALHVIQGQFELGDYHLAKSVELNPNDAQILLRIGYYRSFLGDRYNDLNYVDLAFRRNPLHPDWYWHDRGVVLFAHGDYRGSLNSLLRCQDGIEAGYVYQAACHAALGESSRAASMIGTVRKLNSTISLDWIELAYPYRCYKSNKSMNKLTDLLATAGLR